VALGLEFVSQVGERIGLAVVMSGDCGQGGSREVGAVKARAGEFGAQAGDLR